MELVAIDSVQPSTYNPRVADPARLRIIELSLRKLGFLLPIYADNNGEILSGHQRHLVCGRMGVTRIPVARVPEMDLAERQGVNVLFNRGTNDLATADSPQSMTDALNRFDLDSLSARLPDKVIDSDEFYPCLNAEPVSLDDLIKANPGKWVDYAASVSRTLIRKGATMPIVCTRDLRVVNGIGRVQALSRMGEETAMVVWVTDDEAELADAMLNLLSMDFDIHTRYADVLRHNSFRRKSGTRSRLGMGMIWAMARRSVYNLQFDINREEDREQWVSFYGQPILDFGAGRGTETAMLRENGIDADQFEPYVLAQGTDDIDPEGSRQNALTFLEAVASGKQWQSIFLSAIFNSVPFREDRQHIATILHALAGPYTRLFAYASSIKSTNIAHRSTGKYVNKNSTNSVSFILEYEENVSIADLASGKPKMQKYFTKVEFASYWTPHFRKVTSRYESRNASVTALCTDPLPLNLTTLVSALQHEFNLPYPEGERMGLADEAITAFSDRLGVDLMKFANVVSA